MDQADIVNNSFYFSIFSMLRRLLSSIYYDYVLISISNIFHFLLWSNITFCVWFSFKLNYLKIVFFFIKATLSFLDNSKKWILLFIVVFWPKRSSKRNTNYLNWPLPSLNTLLCIVTSFNRLEVYKLQYKFNMFA